YLRIEKKYELTRQALEVILKHKFPVHIITKSDLVERDIDLLKQIEKQAILPADLAEMKRGTIISFSFSTLQEEVGNIFEPGAPPPSVRLKTVQKMIANNFLTGISFMPLLPYISATTEHLDLAFSTFRDIGV